MVPVFTDFWVITNHSFLLSEIQSIQLLGRIYFKRHCTTGKPGHIILSQNSYSQLDPKITSAIKFEKDKLEMKGKGIVDTYSINLYGSQKNINKKLDPNKLLYSGKSNISMNSARGDKNLDRGFKRQNSIGSKKSGLNSDHNTKQKVQQVSKSQNILSSHFRGKLGNAFMHQNLGTNFMSAVFNLGTAAANPQDLENNLAGVEGSENNLPVQDLLKNQLRNQTAVALLLSQTQPLDAEDGKKDDDNKDGKKDESGSFEDFKSEQSFNSNSDDNPGLRSAGGSLNKETPMKHRGSNYKIDVTEINQVK
jgi:hypothetical protein